MVATFRNYEGFFLGKLLFLILLSASTNLGATNGEEILTSGGNGMNQSSPLKPRNNDGSDVMQKSRKYRESVKDDLLTTLSQTDFLKNDANMTTQGTSTEKSYNSRLQNTQNGTSHGYYGQTVTEKTVNRTTKPESVITTKVEDFNEQGNQNEAKDLYEDTDLNAETSLEYAHQDKIDRSMSDIDALFPDITEDQIPRDIHEDDKILDSYTTLNYDENEPSENVKPGTENLQIGTVVTASSQGNSYPSTTQVRLSFDSISSAKDQISKLPSSHLTTAEDVMYIDLELDDDTHVTRPRTYSYHTKYSFSESDAYHWSSRQSSAVDGNDPIFERSNDAVTNKDSINPTRVITNVPSYTYTQTTLALPEVIDDRNSVIKSGKSITDLSQNYPHSSIESSFSVDSNSNPATNTLTETSQMFLKTEIDEMENSVESKNSTDNYMYQLLHSLKTSSQTMEPSTYPPSKSVNSVEVTSSREENTIDVVNGTSKLLPLGSDNSVVQEFTNNKEILLLTSFYGPTAVKPQASSVETMFKSELITSNDGKITSGFKEDSFEVNTEAVSKEIKSKPFSTEVSKLNTPLPVTTSRDYSELATVTPFLEQVGTESGPISEPERYGTQTPIYLEEQISNTRDILMISSVSPTPTLETRKPDFTRTPDVQVIPSRPCDWSKPTTGSNENAPEENEEELNDMKLPIYIYMRLSLAWPDFCNKQQRFRNHCSHVFSQDKNVRLVEPRQIMFAGIKPCNRSRIQHHHRGVKVYVYTVDAEGNYSENLTQELEVKLQNSQRRTFAAEREREGEDEICEVSIYRVPVRDKSKVTEASSKMSSSGMIAAISISAIAGICLILMFTMLLILKQRQDKDHNSASSSDSYSMDSFAARGGSGRRKRPRLSIRSFLNQAFDEPEIPNHPLNFNNLSSVLQNKSDLEDEFKNIPMDVPRPDTLPQGAEVKNRYANVIPVPETRVPLSSNGEQPGYINANFVKGYGGRSKTYIACQAPLEETIEDFWRMVWEQQSRVVIMLTGLEENGVSRCSPYFPDNTVDCHRLYGDFQVTLLEKDVRENFVKSSLRLHDLEKNLFRDVAHVWYTAWPPQGVPEDAGSFMGCILELRTSMVRNSGPVVVHCSPGTGRTGTFIATDICMHEYQESRCVDILRCVARLRQDRSGAVQTFDQYLFIHEVLHEYALKLGTQSHRPSLMSLVSLKLSHQER